MTRTVSVRRTGGFAGVVRHGTVDLDADPRATELEQLLSEVDLGAVAGSPAAGGADRFQFHVQTPNGEATVSEGDLTAALRKMVDLVLDS